MSSIDPTFGSFAVPSTAARRRSIPLGGRVIAAAVLFTLGFSHPTWGQGEGVRTPEALAAAAQAARDQLDAQRLPDLAAAQQAARTAVADFERYLATFRRPGNHEAWRRYLGMDAFLEALESEEPAQQARGADRLYQRMTRNHEGLERPMMVRMREAAQQLTTAVRFRNPERTIEVLDTQLDQLAERFEQLDAVPAPDDTAAINRVLGLLEQANQTPWFVQQVRSAFAQPNGRVYIGASLINRTIARPVNQTAPVNEVILGTHLVGTSHLGGDVTARLLPAQGAAQVELVLRGQFSSRNTGYNHPVRLQTRGYGSVAATRVVSINDAGVHGGPVGAQATLCSDILSIEHHLRLVRRIAARRASEQKPQADWIAVNRLRSRVAGEFGRQTDRQLAGQGPLPLPEATPVLQRLDLQPPVRLWSSSHDAAQLQFLFRGPGQIATASVPPPPPAGYDLTIQLHESIVDNAASTVLAGRSMSGRQLDRLIASVRPGGEDSADAAAEPSPQDDFVIDFATLRPLVFEARDDMVHVGIRGTRFAQPERELRQPLQIDAAYRVAVAEEGRVFLERDGEISVRFPGAPRLSAVQIAVRRAIQSRFETIFPQRILDRSIDLPREMLPAGYRIAPRHLDASAGWLTVSMQ